LVLIRNLTILGVNHNIGIWLLNLLTAAGGNSLAPLIWLQALLTSPLLIIICGLNVHTFFKDKVTALSIEAKYPFLLHSSLLLIGEAYKHKAETTASSGGAIPHDNGVFNFSILLEIVH
jgi:hypothetical protein